jgi:membrane glycosyltransferase
MTLAKPRVVACCIFAHAVFAYLGAEWIDINILVLLAAICAWPFWWAVLGFRELRTRVVLWSLAAGSVIYLPSVRVILLMLSSARGGPR